MTDSAGEIFFGLVHAVLFPLVVAIAAGIAGSGMTAGAAALLVGDGAAVVISWSR